jgi:hypothetical protein
MAQHRLNEASRRSTRRWQSPYRHDSWCPASYAPWKLTSPETGSSSPNPHAAVGQGRPLAHKHKTKPFSASGALPGNPYDGHTLGALIAATEQLTGSAQATSQLVDFTKGRTLHSHGWGVPEECRRQAEMELGKYRSQAAKELVRIGERMVRLKAPRQMTVIPITGRRIGVPATRIIEVTEEESWALLQNGFKEVRD